MGRPASAGEPAMSTKTTEVERTDEPTAGERMDAGELSLPEDVTECRFCGAGRASLHYESQQRNVDRHSHRGRVAYVLRCDECEGAYIDEQIEQTRVNVPSRPLVAARWWSIPEGYVLSVCEGCGEVAGTHEDDAENYPLFRAMRDGDLTTDCCDADGALKVGEYVVEGSR
jgi:hypothetical protein